VITAGVCNMDELDRMRASVDYVERLARVLARRHHHDTSQE
jgi:hypothetical protein